MGQANGLEAASSKPIENAEANISNGASNAAIDEVSSGGGSKQFDLTSAQTKEFTDQHFGGPENFFDKEPQFGSEVSEDHISDSINPIKDGAKSDEYRTEAGPDSISEGSTYDTDGVLHHLDEGQKDGSSTEKAGSKSPEQHHELNRVDKDSDLINPDKFPEIPDPDIHVSPDNMPGNPDPDINVAPDNWTEIPDPDIHVNPDNLKENPDPGIYVNPDNLTKNPDPGIHVNPEKLSPKMDPGILAPGN